jgi:hypothetical protein
LVLGNQPSLFAQLAALDWASTPVAYVMSERGHGRSEKRTIQVMAAPRGLNFPHAAQVYLAERYFSDLDGGPWRPAAHVSGHGRRDSFGRHCNAPSASAKCLVPSARPPSPHR